MDRKDKFAAAALTGMLANPKWPNVGPSGMPAGEEDCAAHWAYGFADAMIAERIRRESAGGDARVNGVVADANQG